MFIRGRAIDIFTAFKKNPPRPCFPRRERERDPSTDFIEAESPIRGYLIDLNI